jgi:hypothetical protein
VNAANHGYGHVHTRFLRSLFIAVGLFGVKRDRSLAEAIWKTIEINEVEEVLNERVKVLQLAQTEFLRSKMSDPQSEKEYAFALYHFAALRLHIDEKFSMLLLKQLYFNPRFNAIKNLPDLIEEFLTFLKLNGGTSLVQRFVELYDRDPPLNPSQRVQSAIRQYRYHPYSRSFQ